MSAADSRGNRPGKLNRRISGNRLSGFTLVELLVVIAIIALLLSILMPSLKKVRRQAQTVICTSYTKQLNLATLNYTSDNSDRLLPAHSPMYLDAHRFLADKFPDSKIKFPWQYYLWPYHKSWKIYRCPANPESYAVSVIRSPWSIFWYNVPAFGNPRNNGELPNYLPCNFGYNNFIGGWSGGKNPYEPLRLTELRSSIALFSDTYLPNPNYRSQQFSGIHIYEQAWAGCNVDFRHGARSRSLPQGTSGSLVGLDLRYGSKANISFIDGHSELVGPKGVYWGWQDNRYTNYRETKIWLP